ncbi:hypothetical protein W03_05950 [Nitrosomonas sp. PY1]|uniref:hypothetical protein n=1 Tax=Nitrosomonas sp. PY1 TaxID=1803906 RepID=UPI001FC7DC7F|nr:hypothetical protein [Nitrosomonas sp. PY1]GKS68591.1 hypothetical protein W03_05950 [Nitrosomonas sp. PY1]
MKGTTQKLKEAAHKTQLASRQELFKFLDSKSTEFETAENEAAILKILEEAIAQNLLTPEEKNDLLSAIQEPEKKKICKVASDLIADSRSYINALGGMLWLLFLYIGATWLVVGSLSSIQLREDLESSDIKLYRINELIEVSHELEKYKSQSLANVSKWELEIAKFAEIHHVDLDSDTHKTLYKTFCINGIEKNEDCQSLVEATANLNVYFLNINEKYKIIESKKITSSTDSSNQVTNDLRDFLPRIEFMRKFKFSAMLVMPVQVLTLILAIAMGILGSTITMTWAFFNQSTRLSSEELGMVRSLRWNLLRPFVGALSALVIFIFAKAGQMTLLSEAADATLNPFMLSLLGIAAGLFADLAYKRMFLVSSTIFGGTDVEKERWSINLGKALVGKGATPQSLATVLNLDQQRIQDIVNGQQAATSVEQQRISDYLGIPLRELFTDIPP